MHPRRRQGRRVLVGALLIIAMTATATAIFFSQRIRRAMTETYAIVGLFEEARALEPGTPVWIAGQPVGEVRAVDALPPERHDTTRFAAMLEIRAEYMPLVRRDSELGMTSPRLLGDPVVNLMPGTPAAPVLAPGDTLVAREPVTLEATAAAADSLRQAFDALLAEGRTLQARVDVRARDAAAVLASLRAAERELDALVAAVQRGPLTDFLADDAALASLVRVGRAADEIADLARARAERWGDPSLAAAAGRLGRHAASLRTGVDELRKLLEEPRGFIGRWDQDPALRNAVRSVRAQLDSLFAEVRRRPWRWVF